MIRLGNHQKNSLKKVFSDLLSYRLQKIETFFTTVFFFQKLFFIWLYYLRLFYHSFLMQFLFPVFFSKTFFPVTFLLRFIWLKEIKFYFSWLGKYKKLFNKLDKTKHLFMLHCLVRDWNHYTEWCFRRGVESSLPRPFVAD